MSTLTLRLLIYYRRHLRRLISSRPHPLQHGHRPDCPHLLAYNNTLFLAQSLVLVQTRVFYRHIRKMNLFTHWLGCHRAITCLSLVCHSVYSGYLTFVAPHLLSPMPKDVSTRCPQTHSNPIILPQPEMALSPFGT